MAITLLHHCQIDLFEKIVSRQFSSKEIATYQTQDWVDRKTGEPLGPTTISWAGNYVVEAFVNVLETFLLSDKIGAVCRGEDGKAIVGAHWGTVLKSKDFVVFPIAEKDRDRGALDLSFLEWLDDSSDDDDVLTWARAYNGQFDGLGEPVSLRLTHSDLNQLSKSINSYHEVVGREERINDTGVLTSPMIYRAYETLCREYKVKMSEAFGNQTHLVLPPLASAYLGRLPGNATAETMLDVLFTMRKELASVRKKFAPLRGPEHPDVSPAQAQKAVAAINADAKRLAARWNANFTDNTVIQFCLEQVSFVLKCILKPSGIEADEIAGKMAAIAPPLERYMRSSAPTELSRIALETRNVEKIKHLFDAKLGLKFAD